jgi:hypothetical protein
MRAKIVARGIAGEQELDDLDRAAREHLDDPHTLVLPGVYFLAWGRKPAPLPSAEAAAVAREHSGNGVAPSSPQILS